MKHEYRISHINYLDHIIPYKPGIISLGHEGCFLKVPSAKEIINVKKKGNVKLILPKIHTGQMNTVVKLVTRIINSVDFIDVTINDFGTLLRLSNMDRVRLIAGRQLIKSFEQHPQAEYIARRYPEKWHQVILEANIFTHDKIKLLKDYNIAGIEIDILPFTLNALRLSGIRRYFKVYGFFNERLLAIFRACPVARMFHCPLPSCKRLCDNYIHINFIKPNAISSRVAVDDLERKDKLSGILNGNIFLHHNHGDDSENSIEDDIVDIIVKHYPLLPAAMKGIEKRG